MRGHSHAVTNGHLLLPWGMLDNSTKYCLVLRPDSHAVSGCGCTKPGIHNTAEF